MALERFDRTFRESSTRSSRQGTRSIPGSLVRMGERLLSWWAGPHCSRIGRSALSLAASGLLVITMPVLAQSALLPPPAVLKKLSVEELLDIDVTSVSKKEEKLSRAASAIQIITREDIRRSGAASLPEALRLATNLQVAQVDSR